MNIYDISEKAGVSIATVSRILNGSDRVSPQTREKVLAVIEQYGYVPNAFARGLGLNTMKTIGLLCPNAADSYLSQALSFLEKDFRSNGYDCLLCCTGSDAAERQKGVEMLLGKHVDGMVLMGSTFIEEKDEGNEYIRNAAKTTPLVLLNADMSGKNIYCVLCDDRTATREAAQYLLDTGRKRILYLYHNNNRSGQKKLLGYRDALESRGIPVDEKLIRFFGEDKMSVPEVRDFLLQTSKKVSFDAVMTSEDILAVGAAKYAHVVGRTIPDDLSVIGYNHSMLSLCSEPELTTIDNKLGPICACCVRTLLGVLGGEELPKKTVFTAELVKRGSTL